MRPLKLTMQAIGPYAEKTVLNFEQLGTEGVYLITGDTGAGKSTIFDAVSFALYGETSGGDRKAAMMPSRYADFHDRNVKPQVELVFSCGGKLCTVCRTPQFRRPGNASMTPAAASLHVSGADEHVITNIKEVTAAIEQMIGLKQEQFSQVAMLAQGKFTRLLLGSTKDKQEIFRDLFRTQNYVAFQEQARAAAAAAEAAWRAAGAEIRNSAGTLDCPAGSSAAEAAQTVSSPPDEKLRLLPPFQADIETLLEELQQLIEADTEKEQQLQAEEQRLNQQIDALSGGLTLAEKAEENRAAKNAAAQKRSALEAALPPLREDLQKKEENPLRAELRDATAALEHSLTEMLDLEAKQHTQEAERNRLRTALQEARETEQAAAAELAQMQAESETLAAAETEIAQLTEQKKQQEAARDALKGLNQDLTDWQNAETALAAEQEKLEQLQARLQAEKAALQETEKQQETLQTELNSLQSLDAEQAKLDSRRQLAQARKAALQKLENLSGRWAAAARTAEAEQAAYLAAQAEADAALDDWKQKNHRFLAEQAGILADALEAGAPCPVCGSVEHPHPAEKTSDVPTQAEVQQALQHSSTQQKKADRQSGKAQKAVAGREALEKQLLEDMQAQGVQEPAAAQAEAQLQPLQAAAREELAAVEEKQERLTADAARRETLQAGLLALEPQLLPLRNACTELETQIQEAGRQEGTLCGSAQTLRAVLIAGLQKHADLQNVTPETAAAPVAAGLRNTEQALQHIQEELEIRQNQISRQEALKNLIPEQETALKERQTAAQNLENDLTVQEKLLSDTASQLQDRLQVWSAASTADAAALLDRKRREMAELDALAEAARKELTRCEAELHDQEQLMAQLEAQLAGSPTGTSAELRERKEALQKERSENAGAQRELHGRLQKNRPAYAQIKTKSRELEDLQRTYAWTDELYMTVQGGTAGEDGESADGKVTLETWVQMAFFDQVLAKANLRLRQMTNDQFELVRRAPAGRGSYSGLDLDVIDYYNGDGKASDIRTLSGGETFMASLALALGMADEVQAEAGGVQLDTMFIDEGFGSLDEDALKQAIRTLTDLSEGRRLIGIISHVATLQELIRPQILVRKAKAGGSRAVIRV